MEKPDSRQFIHSGIIEIWSTYPPPFGGVSVHSMRLFESLKKTKLGNNIIFKNFNGKYNSPENSIHSVNCFFLEFIRLFCSSKRIIHLHSNNLYLWLVFSLFIWRHKVIITLHNQKLKYSLNFIETIIRKVFLLKAGCVILNDNSLADSIHESYHIKISKFHIIPAFIPPLPEENIGLDERFIKFRQKHKFLISTSAWKLYRKGNIDVYGIDQIIEAMNKLKAHSVFPGLIIIIPISEDSEYERFLINKVNNYNLWNQILLIRESIPNAFEVWKLSDLYIRATSTDIEGLTIKEALFYNTPVIASDVVDRPEGCILYKLNNTEDLKDKIVYVMNSDSTQSPHINFINTINKIYSLYNSL